MAKNHDVLIDDVGFGTTNHWPSPGFGFEYFYGKFDQGWDRLREETFARQKALGVVPADAELTKRHKEIPAWKDLPADPEAQMKVAMARQ